MKADSQNLENQLKKIIESDQFSRSGVNVSLLSLLFYATIDGRKLKETTIGSEIFGKNYDPIKNDTKVRVYVHNLRKKLAAYYDSTGKSDEIIFEIEKGEYRVIFKSRKEETKVPIGRKLVYVFLIIVCLFIAGVLIFSVQKKNLAFWSGFSSKLFPTTVLIGDHFTIESVVPTGGTGIFRDFSINSDQDYSEHIRQHPKQAPEMIPNRYPYITKMGPYCTKMFSDFFHEQKLPFELMLNSEWDKTKINAENIIYAGQFKTMGFLKNLFNDHFPIYEIAAGSIKRIDPLSAKATIYTSRSGNPIVDFTVVSRMKGPKGNDIAMFISDNDIGVIRVVDYFTNKDSLEIFYERNHLIDQDFTALFKVSGWDRTGYSVELIHVDVK